MTSRRGDEAAVSDVVGSILLVAVTVLTAGAFGFMLLAFDGPSDSQHTSLAVSIGPGADGEWGVDDAELRIRHMGGEPLDEGRTEVAYTLPGASPTTLAPTFTGGRLTIGQEWIHVLSASPGDAIPVQVLARSGGSSALLASGTVVAGADVDVELTYASSFTATLGTVSSFASAQDGDDADATAILSEAAQGGGGTAALSGTTHAHSGAASPASVLASDDQRATLPSTGSWVEAAGLPVPAGASVTQVLIGFEGHGTASSSTVAHQQTVTATGSSGATSVASPSITGALGQFYLAAVANGDSPLRTVTGVSGLGLAWSQVAAQTSSSNDGRLEVWRGSGTPTAGAVTATFSGATDRAAIAVSRYSGVDLTSPVQASSASEAAGSGSAAWATSAVTGSTGGRFYVALNVVQQSGAAFVTPSSERADFGASQVQLALADGPALVGANLGSGTVSGGSADWQAIALTLRPQAAATPQATLSYRVGASTGASAGSFTMASGDQAYTLDVTADRAWTLADIGQLSVRVAALDASGGPLLVDHAYATVTTSVAATTYALSVTVDVAAVPDLPTHTLQLRYRVGDPGDTFTASLWTGAAWRDCPGTLSSTVLTTYSCPLALPAEYQGGTPRLRFQDSNPAGTAQGGLHLDYVRVASR